MKKKKSKLLLVFGILCIVLGGYLILNKPNKANFTKVERQANINESPTSPVVFKEITLDEYRQMIKSGESFTVYIGRPDCSTCKTFEPTLNDFLASHKGGTLYYFNTKSIRDAAQDEGNTDAKTFYESVRSELNFKWTPTLNYYSEGKLKSSFEFLNEAYYDEKDTAKQTKIVNRFAKDAKAFLSYYVYELK